MLENKPTVFIVDDDLAVRDSLRTLLETVHIPSVTFQNADEFLLKFDPSLRGCLILDVRMPGLSGPELQRKLKEQKVHIPTIMISGHGDIRIAVECVQEGAIDFIEKPLRDQRILELVQKAFVIDEKSRQSQAECHNIEVRLSTLSHREQEVLEVVISGKSNKVIASELSISHKTVESHRTNIMRKMKAQSIADLVRMSLTAKSYQAT